ncbi:MAG: hypothetical protein QOJ59_5400 [Thermomicrobiales bacterium]|jgi:hypothetical protein|nr:hypothetical protein [Thermomicrobiales bacterium]
MALDDLSREYLSLSFAIERLFPGFVDAYFGPPEFKDAANAEPDPDPAALLARAHELASVVAAADLLDSRKDFLAAQVGAMVTICRKLTGEPIDYVHEVRTLFDVEPAFTPEAAFDVAIAELDELLPGEGDVRERMIAWRKQYVVDTEIARQLIDLIAAETRRRTEALVSLPEGEGVEIAFVQDKPWSGYNWYLGDYRSRVEINTDLPIHAHELTALIAHEGYPGHHTEHALKEQILYRDHGYGENAIQLINTPECVISEGIATLAESIAFPDGEAARWQAEHLYPIAGLTGDPERESRIARARIALRAVSGNAALLLHQDGRSEEEVLAYLMRFGLRAENEARQSLRFIADPLWRAYTFTYHVGRDLLGRWLALAPTPERQSRFRLLLVGQVSPSQIQRWIADETITP